MLKEKKQLFIKYIYHGKKRKRNTIKTYPDNIHYKSW